MKSLDAALKLLSEFTGKEADISVSELSAKTGMPKSQVSKILLTFRKNRFLEKDDTTQRYSVGPRAFALGSRFVNHNPLTRAALPVMRELTERSGHSTRLCIRVDCDVLYMLGIEGPHFIDTGWRVGQWMPMHASSAARVFLAEADEAEIDRILLQHGMPALTERTVQDADELKVMLREARATGFARNYGETARGLSTLSVPVFGHGGILTASLTIAFPSHVVDAESEPDLVEMMHRSARTLSQKIGCEVYPYGNLNLRSVSQAPVSAERSAVNAD